MEHIPDDKGVLAEMVRVLKPGGRIAAVTVPRYGPEKVCWALSDAYHEVEGGHIHALARPMSCSAGCAGSPSRTAPTAPTRCTRRTGGSSAFGVDNDKALPVKAYHKLPGLGHHEEARPDPGRRAAAQPGHGKSFVAYATKPHLPHLPNQPKKRCQQGAA